MSGWPMRSALPQMPQAKIECSVCGWRHTVPCGRDDCPHDAATNCHYISGDRLDAIRVFYKHRPRGDVAFLLAQLDDVSQQLEVLRPGGLFAWKSKHDALLAIIRDIVNQWEGAEWCDAAVKAVRESES
jgi:hypothetical protein